MAVNRAGYHINKCTLSESRNYNTLGLKHAQARVAAGWMAWTSSGVGFAFACTERHTDPAAVPTRSV